MPKPMNLSSLFDRDNIKDRKVSLRPGPMEAYAPLSLTTYNTMAAIRNVVLRKL